MSGARFLTIEGTRAVKNTITAALPGEEMPCCVLCKANGNRNVKSEIIKRQLILKATMTVITYSHYQQKNSARSIQLSEVISISYSADFKEKSCRKQIHLLSN